MSEEERKKRHKMSQRRYALNNPEKVKETSRRYREKHYEEIRARWKSPEYLKKIGTGRKNLMTIHSLSATRPSGTRYGLMMKLIS